MTTLCIHPRTMQMYVITPLPPRTRQVHNPDEFGFCCPLCFMRLAEERLGPMVFKVSQEVYE